MRVILAIVVAAMAAITIELLTLLVAAAVAAIAHPGSMDAIAVAFQIGLIAGMMVGGGVAYEIGRLRGAVAGFAVLPLAVAAFSVVTDVAVRRTHFELGDTMLLASALVSGAAALAGGALWERHIRRTQPLD